MPLLEVTQTKHVSASIRLTDSTAIQLNQYGHFIGASADEVIEEALKHIFAKDREFQDFLKTPQAKEVASTLRVRKAPVVEPTSAQPKPPAKAVEASASVAGSRA
jgi:hypothetical protein